MSEDNSERLLWIVAGAAVGAALAMVLAPQSGAATRAYLADRAGESGSRLGEGGRQLFDRGRELYEKGLQIADEAADLFEQGRRIVETPPPKAE